MAVVTENKGRTAISVYSTLENFSEHTLLEVHPLTGRTHQIRLHLAFIGCPVVGDRVYGRRKVSLDLKRQFLHAYQIAIVLPGECTPTIFQAPLAEDLKEVLDALRRDSLKTF
jgi:23S rRNA pseudouridine1911/1915/1917 synthase